MIFDDLIMDSEPMGFRTHETYIDGEPPKSLENLAILVRASHQMRMFEDRFLTIGLPYRVIGGPRFYERMESEMLWLIYAL